MKIRVNNHGYPIEEDIEALRNWSGPLAEMPAVLNAVAEYLTECGYGSAKKRGGCWRFVTGGWSGCEEVIGAIPPIVDAVAWESSHRGGLHVYRIGGRA